MSTVLNRTTKLLITSANTPEYPVIDWIINPDLSSVDGEPAKYWIITGDIVTLATIGEQAIIDAAIDAGLTLESRTVTIAETDSDQVVGFRVRALIELLNKRDNYLTNRIIQLQNAMDAMKASSGPADNIRNAIPAIFLPSETRDRSAAVQDYTDDIAAGGADT